MQVQAMDGPHYQVFEKHCCQGYNILRKSANLILNLIALMLDSGIPHLSGDGELIILKVCNFVFGNPVEIFVSQVMQKKF
jgi:phosphatidylinositol 3-kinase